MNTLCIPLALMAMVGFAEAAVVVKPLAYEIDGQAFEGLLVYDDAISTPRPGLVMVPNWLGVTERSAEKAARAAGKEYVVFMADLYGKTVRPSNPDEAKAAATTLRSDRGLMRTRGQAAVDAFRAQNAVALDTGKMAAIGFCFGGGAVLELARSGADLDAFVSFHGNLDTPNPDDASQIKAPVLVLHGADDPAVPKEQVEGFIAEMQATDVDWQMNVYGNAVHSFTDPYANVPGRNEYNPLVAKRAFQSMNNLLDEVFASQ
ncbi:dienelactone hydrolase family protein [Pseudomonas sp. SST3]|uniref:dienelactone hydrolase family protein n=2 Tax=Pseudomonas sp. SST3 TaxID=2267882 RepID=UPI000DF96373|nr:dienelactone hydrolase family protein [Pseudomonas sp. SST3]NKQ10939.1 dienelactone hydrolase family protein [Pseudomonas sp. SST3]